MDVSVAAMILLAGLLSGFVDAVAGGGGLIMIPSLMLGGLPAHAAVATNKLCGTTGYLTSSVTFVRARLVDWRACALVGIPAVLGAVAGSRLISVLSADRAEPAVMALLVAVTLWVIVKPRLGRARRIGAGVSGVGAARAVQAAAIGALVGFHDGFFGPGAGGFMTVALLTLWSFTFIRGTGSATVIALMTNVAAVVSFLWAGAVDLPKGLIAAAGVAVGAHVGASMALTRAAVVIKPLFVLATTVILGKLVVSYVAR